MIEQERPIYAQDDEVDSDPILTGDDEDDDEDSDVPDPPEEGNDL